MNRLRQKNRPLTRDKEDTMAKKKTKEEKKQAPVLTNALQAARKRKQEMFKK